MSKRVVRTRMAPSPTGEYHVGHLATLLKNYAWAKHNGGSFILRIEDTDQVRKVEGSVEKILSVIRQFGLDWDEGPDKEGPHGPYVQSQRLEIYHQYVQQLLDSGAAYYCFCSKQRLDDVRTAQQQAKQPPRYDGHCRDLDPAKAAFRKSAGEACVVRLKVPSDQDVVFQDVLRGEITIHSSEVDDQVLMKSDGFPTYHLGVVVDDHLMQISHVIRGEEWISSTPKHVLLYQAFGWSLPTYAHVPVFLNPDGKGKMSKRKGTVSAQSFLDDGYLPEALLNFLMILGWTPKDQHELLSLREYVEQFDPADMSAKSVVFDLDKLRWLNGVYIRSLSDAELSSRLTPFIPNDFPENGFDSLLPLVKERLVTLKDIESMTAFFYREIEIPREELLRKATPDLVSEQLVATAEVLRELPTWNTDILEKKLRELQEEQDWKRRQYFMMLRVATTGQVATPPLFDTLKALGKDSVLARLQAAGDSL